MKKLSIVLLTLVFSSVSFAAADACKIAVDNVIAYGKFAEKLGDDRTTQYVVQTFVHGDERVRCKDLRSATHTMEMVNKGLLKLIENLRLAESLGCELGSEIDYTSAEATASVASTFTPVLKKLQDAQQARNCY